LNGKELESGTFVISTIGEDVFLGAVKAGDVVTVGDIKAHKPLKTEQEKVRVIPKGKYVKEDAFAGLEYDSTDEAVQKCPTAGAFKDYPEKIEIEDSGKWKTFTFRIEDGRFNNSCNGADFRFSAEGEFCISRITITKAK